MALGPKKHCIFGPKISFFLRYAHITHFFGLRQTRLNGIISCPYPQVTLDAFCFLVGVHSAAQQAVFWHPLTKMALFGLKMLFFLRYAHITHFFGLRQTRLNGIISSPYPKVTLDAFGFPVSQDAYSLREGSKKKIRKKCGLLPTTPRTLFGLFGEIFR